MSMVRKSIRLTQKQSEWLDAHVSTGHYGDDSELIQELIDERQLLEQEHSDPVEVARSREALIVGEKSGIAEMTARDLLAELKRELRQNEKL